ncbi:hypothetical protein ACHAXS_003120 [Conticribra weissflogii]
MSATQAPNDSTLPPCGICNKKIAIYCCPRCSIKTCSLECCRSHKLQSNPIDGQSEQKAAIVCNGKRDRTKFCSLNQFSDSQLASDYHFLEDVLKVSESSKRIYQGIASGHNRHNPTAGGAKRARTDTTIDELKNIANDKPPVHPLLKAREGSSLAQVLASGVSELEPEGEISGEKSPSCVSAIQERLGEQSIVPSKKQTPPSHQRNKRDNHVDNLVRQAELKGVQMLRMPLGMERRKSNTTKFNKKKVITWKIELCFHTPTANATNSTVVHKDGGSETHIIPKMVKVESHMSETSTLSEELGKHLDVHPGNSTIRSQLRLFACAPRDKLMLLLKRLPCSSAAPQYHKLDRNATLGENLNGKTIIEFPTIDVIFEEDREKYPLFIGEM